MTSSSTREKTSMSLLRRAADSDSNAWHALVDLYGPLVGNWCLTRGLKPEDASDVVQTVFIAVSKNLSRFQPRNENGAFRAWLWTITRNKIRDWARSQRPDSAVGGSSANQRIIQLEAPDEFEPEPTSAFDINELTQRAMSQIRDSIAPQTWNAFWRTVVEGQTTDNVSQELGLSPASVRQARSRVLRKLREQLGDA
ncbi:MAG: sigma-70 family RNA polymerase sigma factor [Pirellulaceae bacterium]